jgi:hypothetical protein
MKLFTRSRWIVLAASCAGVLFLGARAQLAVGQGAAPAPAAPRAGGTGAGGQRQTAPPASPANAGQPIHVLFLGMDEERPHNPARMFPHLSAPLARRGIQLTYVADQAEALDPAKLKYYDLLMIYGNQLNLKPVEEAAIVGFVEGGKGLVALHAASAMFTNSDSTSRRSERFRHMTRERVGRGHPAVACGDGAQSFTAFDVPYVHTKHNPQDRTSDGAAGSGRHARALDMGADARAGTRVLHGVRARRAGVGPA